MNPMKSEIVPIIAQYVMDDLLESCISHLNFDLRFLFKYVFEIITAVPKNQIDYTLLIFNGYN